MRCIEVKLDLQLWEPAKKKRRRSDSTCSKSCSWPAIFNRLEAGDDYEKDRILRPLSPVAFFTGDGPAAPSSAFEEILFSEVGEEDDFIPLWETSTNPRPYSDIERKAQPINADTSTAESVCVFLDTVIRLAISDKPASISRGIKVDHIGLVARLAHLAPAFFNPGYLTVGHYTWRTGW